MKIIALLITGLALLSEKPAFAVSHGMGNGGDAVVQEFLAFGKETVKLLPFLNTTLITSSQINGLQDAILSAKIVSKDNLILKSVEVDAINYPNKGIIEVNRKRWQNKSHLRNSRWALALHEYLWLANIDDTDYKISNLLFNDLLYAKARWQKSPIAKALTEAICTAIFSRDYATIENALQMGADLSVACSKGGITFQCKDGHSEYMLYYVTDYPLERAINEFGTDKCARPWEINKDQDFEMQKILDLMLSYKPDLTKSDYGILKTYSLLEEAASRRTYLGYTSLLKAGADPNLNPTFGGLTGYPFRPIEFFKAATEAGADANLSYANDPDHIIAASFLRGVLSGSDDIVKYLVENHKINFCLESFDDSYGPKKPLIQITHPRFIPFIQSIGDPCTKL